ncbi:GAP family protein [Mycobacterium helveticum]|uniref:GAP family protein n=1 Tax=Mycobacterium helveticum TaxID=2592811 RepID=A0A557XW54_9MYCO|nr:GAP family protein [Mycobacterium helveticum]TVS86232.1 GAP family protein [Mycobacterium helveticum]TVS90248.1 GAP family protein [Mycobacterium helveticum]
MWGIVLWMALVTAPDPVRMGIAILLISRPRPLLNLFAFWLGGMTTGAVAGLTALLVLRDALPALVHDMTATTARFTGGHGQIVVGVLALSIAAIGAMRRPARVPVAAASLPQSSTPTAFSRLVSRARNTLGSGNPWVAFVVGLGQATPPVQYLTALTAILASGAAFATQLGAAVAFTAVTLVLVEIPLVSYLVAPAKTEAITLQAHGWMRTHSRRILVVSAGVLGVVMLAQGTGVA